MRAEAQASSLSCRARRLFAHLPDDVVDALCDPQAPPRYREISGRTTLLAPRTIYVLDGDQVLCVRGLDDDSNEIITYRDKRLLTRSVMADDDKPGST